ncbi:sucrase ferredoxin [Marinobacter fonticola]|uniref:sucrase ferredoxin n=1 Tax=Marinobacter fonticola TaxID=2603215 RepID=UPI0011E70AA2|nr:sucrase ferredoxin [Marinobacter fonticola]
MADINRVFCAVQSRDAGDPLAGTGAHAQRNLLISWPSGKWLRSLRRASDMSEAVVDRIEAVVAAGRRVNLIHRRQQPANRHRIYLMPEKLQLDVEREQLPDVLDALLNNAPLDRWCASEAPKPLILCCTHGKKDKCCAKFGNATYQSLVKVVAESGHAFEVWQSSHLGGCRLAASVMVFPSTRKYGRLGEADIMPLLDAEANDRPYPPCYRGHSALTPVEQCAEVAALQWLAERNIVARVSIGPIEPGEGEETITTVSVNWQNRREQGQLLLRCVKSEVLRFDTCADIGPDGPTASAVWRVQHLKPVPH